ncbi:MAG: DinB family protein [Janthinobacterium lividum]
MTAQEYMAEQTERMGPMLAHFIAATAPDKLRWEPFMEGSDSTRSVLDQVAECVDVNRQFAASLRGDEIPPASGSSSPIEFTDAQDAQDQIIASARELAVSIRGLDDEALERTFQSSRGPRTGRNLIIAAYRNMAYHAGQIQPDTAPGR